MSEYAEKIEVAIIDMYKRLYPYGCYVGSVSALLTIETELSSCRNSQKSESGQNSAEEAQPFGENNNARDAIFSELSKRVSRLENLTKGLTGDHVRG